MVKEGCQAIVSSTYAQMSKGQERAKLGIGLNKRVINQTARTDTDTVDEG